MLRSLGLMEISADRVDNRIVETRAEYFETLADVFHLPLTHLTTAQHDELWTRANTQYENWLAAQGCYVIRAKRVPGRMESTAAAPTQMEITATAGDSMLTENGSSAGRRTSSAIQRR